MKRISRRTGVNAGTENRLYVLRMPPANAVSEMKRMYGKVIRSICTAMPYFSGLAENPGAVT